MTRLTRAERKEQTRADLVAAARRVFGRQGFHAATLDDIADEAGDSKGAVYSNFEGKDELFLAVLDARYEGILRTHRTLLREAGTLRPRCVPPPGSLRRRRERIRSGRHCSWSSGRTLRATASCIRRSSSGTSSGLT